jgi:hypothetical protein
VDDSRHFTRAKHRVYLWDLGLQLVTIALGKTTCDHQPTTPPRLLELGHLQDGVDRLLLRLVDERAGVHDEHVGGAGVVRNLVTGSFGKTEHHLGIHEVLRAPQGQKTDSH